MANQEPSGIQQALTQGYTLRIFRSGGGLRVAYLRKDGVDLGYGEHPHVEEALAHCSEDFLAGGREYHEVYGEGKLYPLYLTGAPEASSPLDAWIVRGRTVDCWQDGEQVACSLKALHPRTLENLEYIGQGKSVWDAIEVALNQSKELER